MAHNQKTWSQTFKNVLVSGTVASIVSTITLALLGKSELDQSAAPLNGPSQWIWGRDAPYQNRFSLRYTIVGCAIHHAASLFWAILHEKLRQNLGSPPNRIVAIAPAIMATSAAYVVDFYIVPKRLTPGFEHRLSKRSLFLVYGTFAFGLATAALVEGYCKAPNKRMRNRLSRTP